MTPAASTGLVIVAAIVLFMANRLPVIVVAIGVALALWATGVVTLEQALAGFGDRAVLFIASLFIVSAALEATGVTAAIGQRVIRIAGNDSRGRLLVAIMLPCALLTALISAGGAVAALIPVVVVAAIRLGIPSSQLMMPLAFAAHAGANLLLTGAPKNVLVSEALEDAGLPGFGFFEFAFAGVPLLAGTILIVVLFGKRLLPQRNGLSMPADFTSHARTLVEQYGLTRGLFRLRMRASCPYVGQPASAIDLSDWPGLQLVGVQQGASGAPLKRPTLAEGDTMLLRGDADAAAAFAAARHLAPRDDGDGGADTLFSRASGLAEVVIPPRSALIGRTVFPGMVAADGDLVVLALQRAGEDAEPGETVLQAGDTLLLQGTWKALDTKLAVPDVLVVDSPDLVRRQAVPMGAGARGALAILAGMVVLLATGVVPPAVAGLLAAGAVILAGILTVDEAYKAINWTTIILVGAMMPLSTAMVQTGAAKLLADQLVAQVGDGGPIALLAGLFVLTAVLGQIMSNTATTLLVIPVAMAAAADLGVSPRPVMMSLCVAGAASFLTPIATSTNLMVMGPGGYAFGDYWKLGLPLMLFFFVIGVGLVPLIWRF
jgi:di/tricarboxylate transporter